MAWQLAARIAVSLKHEFIEKEHLFIAIFSLEKLIEQGSGPDGTGKIDISLRSSQALKKECQALEELLTDFGVTCDQLRKGVLVQLRPGTSTLTEDVIHRNYNCKLIFTRAEELAKLAGASFSCLHLLTILMKNPSSIIDNALNRVRILPRLFWQKLLTATGQTNVYATTFQTPELNTCFMFQEDKTAKHHTILAGRIIGSKDLIEELGELQLCCLLEERNELIKRIVERNGRGEMIKSVEKGLLAVFSTSMAAVESAVDIQEGIPKQDQLQMGFGLERGVINRSEAGRSVEISGDAVTLAQKMAKIATGGEILASEEVFKQVGSTSVGNVKWEPAGSCEVAPGKPAISVHKATSSLLFNPNVI